MRHARVAAAILAVLPAAGASSGPNTPRAASTGILGVPDAETLDLGESVIGLGLRLDRGPASNDAGFAPLAAAFGFGRLEIGAALREGGSPGDARPLSALGTVAAKLRLLQPEGARPGFALGGGLDRANASASGNARLIASTAPMGPFRLAATAGAEGSSLRGLGAAFGVAAAARLNSQLDLLAAGESLPGGRKLEAAVRWSPVPWIGLSAGVERLPDDALTRFTLSIAVEQRVTPRRAAAAPPPAPAAARQAGVPAAPVFEDERPSFRMRAWPRRGAQAEPEGAP